MKRLATNSASGDKNIISVNGIIDTVLLKTMRDIVNERISFANFENESKWMSKQSVYKYLLRNMSSINDDTLLAFKTVSDSRSFGLIEKIDSNIAIGNYTTAVMLNNSINPNVNPEQAYKDYYTVFINSLANQNGALTQNDIVDLKAIAALCPYEYGNAVLKARLLLSFVDTAKYVNNCDVQSRHKNINNTNENNNINNNTVSAKTNETMQAERALKVYPNPANSELFIEYKLNEGEKGYVVLFNSLGIKVNEYDLNKNFTKVDLNKYSSGLYYYRISINGVVIKNDKLSIIK
ncbi:MAG: T9SS type A sorting domain-containing protein [Bacteroidales bacterium]|nr:T9SS type A sorting domain-containing protein [Bacteroidales bacterium]